MQDEEEYLYTELDDLADQYASQNEDSFYNGYNGKDIYSSNGVDVFLTEGMSFNLTTDKWIINWFVYPCNDFEVRQRYLPIGQSWNTLYTLKTNIPFDLRMFCMTGKDTIPQKIKIHWSSAEIVNAQVDKLLAGQTIKPISQLGAFT